MDGFERHCQLMLHSLFGMSFQSLLEIFDCVALNRFAALANSEAKTINGVRVGKQHALFDLKAIQSVMKEMIDVELDEAFRISSQNLLAKINEIVD